MLLHIYSLRKPVFQKEVVSVNLKTSDGEITILDNHRPLITPLEKGPIRIIDLKGSEELFEATQGFVEVRPKGEVSILID